MKLFSYGSYDLLFDSALAFAESLMRFQMHMLTSGELNRSIG